MTLRHWAALSVFTAASAGLLYAAQRAVTVSAASGAVNAAPARSRSPSPVTQPTVEQKAEALAAKWKARFQEERFSVVVAGPFVIAGNGSPARLARYRDGTIMAAAQAFWAQFFDARPTEPILILLFETPGPYKRLAKKWFNDEEVPHY